MDIKYESYSLRDRASEEILWLYHYVLLSNPIQLIRACNEVEYKEKLHDFPEQIA